MPYSVPSQRGTGEIDFGPAARIELHPIQLCFFDHHLKGLDNGLDREPPVRVFVMGDNQWRDEQEWPREPASRRVTFQAATRPIACAATDAGLQQACGPACG